MHEYSQKILTLLRGTPEDENMGLSLLRSAGPVTAEIAADLLLTLSDPWNSNRLPHYIPNQSELILEMVGWLLDNGNPGHLNELQKIVTIPVVNFDIIPSKLDRLSKPTIDLTHARIADDQYTLSEEVFNGSMRLDETSLPKFNGVFNRVIIQGSKWLSVVSQWRFHSLVYTDGAYTVEFTNMQDQPLHERCMALCVDLRSNTMPEKLVDIASRNGFIITRVDFVYNGSKGEEWKSWVHNRPTMPISMILSQFPDLKYLNLGHCVWSPDLETIEFDTNHPLERIEWRQSLFDHPLPQYLQFSSQNEGPTLRERLVEAKVFKWTDGLGKFSNLQHLILLESWVHTTLHIPSLSVHGRIEQQSCLGDLLSRIQSIPDDTWGDDWGRGRYFGYEQDNFRILGEADCLGMLGLKYPGVLNRKGSRLSCLQYLLSTQLSEAYDFSILLPRREMTWFVRKTLKQMIRTPEQFSIWERLSKHASYCKYSYGYRDRLESGFTFENYSAIWRVYQGLYKKNIPLAKVKAYVSDPIVSVSELTTTEKIALAQLYNVGVTLIPEEMLIWDWMEHCVEYPDSLNYVAHVLNRSIQQNNTVDLEYLPLIEQLQESLGAFLPKECYLQLTKRPSLQWIKRLSDLFDAGIYIVWSETDLEKIESYISDCPDSGSYLTFVGSRYFEWGYCHYSLTQWRQAENKRSSALPLLLDLKHHYGTRNAIVSGKCKKLNSPVTESQMLALVALYQQDVHILPAYINFYDWVTLHEQAPNIPEYIAFAFKGLSRKSVDYGDIELLLNSFFETERPLLSLDILSASLAKSITLSKEHSVNKIKILELFVNKIITIPESIDIFDWLAYCERYPEAWTYVQQVLLPRCTKETWSQFEADVLNNVMEYPLVLKMCQRIANEQIQPAFSMTQETQKLLLRLHKDAVTLICSPFNIPNFDHAFGHEAQSYTSHVLEYWTGHFSGSYPLTKEYLYVLLYRLTSTTSMPFSFVDVMDILSKFSNLKVVHFQATTDIPIQPLQRTLIDLYDKGCTIYFWHQSHVMDWIGYVEQNPAAQPYVISLIKHIFQQRPHDNWTSVIRYCLECIFENHTLSAFYLDVIAQSKGCNAGVVEQIRNHNNFGNDEEMWSDTAGLFDWLKTQRIIRDWSTTKLVCFNIPSSILEMLLSMLSNEVQHIELNHCDLIDLPVELRKFSHLQRLMVYGNRLESLPEWIGELTSLQYLSISNNPFIVFPKGVRKLQELKRVYTKNVEISSEDQQWVDSLSI